MNTLAGSITFKGTLDLNNTGLYFLLNQVREGIFNIFMYGNTQFESSTDVVNFIKGKVNGEVLNYDVSISTEDKIQLFEKNKKGEYVLKTIQGKDVTFESVLKSTNKEKVISIREAEKSKIFGNRIIKIDIINNNTN